MEQTEKIVQIAVRIPEETLVAIKKTLADDRTSIQDWLSTLIAKDLKRRGIEVKP